MSEEVNAALAEEETGVIIDGEEETTAPEVTAASDAEIASEDTAKESSDDEITEQQKAINKLAFEKREEKRQRLALEEELKTLRANQPKPAETTNAQPVIPKESDFDYDTDAYNQALSKYHSDVVDYRFNQKMAEQRQEQEQTTRQKTQTEIQNKWNENVAKAKIPNFAEAVSNLPVFHPDVLLTLMQADNGVQVAHYLSKYQDQADVIANSSPYAAAMKIGEISARISNAKTTKNPSAAPEPIKPINQGGATISDRDGPLLKGATFE